VIEKEKIVYKEKESQVEKILKEVDINNLTPIEALNLLNELIKILKNDEILKKN
jgi:DNA mismatch repair ATPase MutS